MNPRYRGINVVSIGINLRVNPSIRSGINGILYVRHFSPPIDTSFLKVNPYIFVVCLTVEHCLKLPSRHHPIGQNLPAAKPNLPRLVVDEALLS